MEVFVCDYVVFDRAPNRYKNRARMDPGDSADAIRLLCTIQRSSSSRYMSSIRSISLVGKVRMRSTCQYSVFLTYFTWLQVFGERPPTARNSDRSSLWASRLASRVHEGQYHSPFHGSSCHSLSCCVPLLYSVRHLAQENFDIAATTSYNCAKAAAA